MTTVVSNTNTVFGLWLLVNADKFDETYFQAVIVEELWQHYMECHSDQLWTSVRINLKRLSGST
jgi:hypothetical protein